MLTRITNYLKAGYPCLYLVSHEEARIERTIAQAAAATDRLLFAWDIAKGRHEVMAGTVEGITDPVEILESVASMPDNSLLLLRDFHLFLTPDFPGYAVLIRRFKDALIQGKARGITLLILAPNHDLLLLVSGFSFGVHVSILATAAAELYVRAANCFSDPVPPPRANEAHPSSLALATVPSLSLSEISEYSSIKYSTLVAIKSNLYNNLRTSTILKLSAFFNVSIAQLLKIEKL
jgi:hypothetical protein